ncbi:MAG TPA: molybdopterin-dependent oxidoreductase [Lacipirellulaceae bacterium]|jgi:hypothetical protein
MTGVLSTWILNFALMLQVSAGTEVGHDPSANAAPSSSAALTLIDEAGASHAITADDFSRLPRQTVKVMSHGNEAEFAGASLVNILTSCGVEFGEKLKGRRASTVAVLDATDGYRIVVSLLEIDPATTEKVVLVADQRDGSPLSDKEGPYRLVIPGDKREIRWIRNLHSIRVVNLKDVPLENSRSNEVNNGQK